MNCLADVPVYLREVLALFELLRRAGFSAEEIYFYPRPSEVCLVLKVEGAYHAVQAAGLSSAQEAKIVGNELHLTIPIGPTVCPLCKVAYPHGFEREMTEEEFNKSGQTVSRFVGLLGFCGDGTGRYKWGWVHDKQSGESYLLCGKCYEPVEEARRADYLEEYKANNELVRKCRQQLID